MGVCVMGGSFLKGAVVGLVCALLGGATVALAGSGVGGVFNLGVSNPVDAKTTLTGASPNAQLQVTNTYPVAGAAGLAATSKSSSPTGSFTNTAGGPAGAFLVNPGVTPFTVNSTGKVANLNADLFDGLNSTAFLRNQVPLSLKGAVATNGVITGTNTGGANGVQGEASAFGVSGVYGQSDGAGYGVAGRANAPGGVGVYAESTGGGPALKIHASVGAPPMSVDSSAKVQYLNADQVDGLDPRSFVVGDPGGGGRLLPNRLAPAFPGQVLLGIPGMGLLTVQSCDNVTAQLRFDTGGTGNVDLAYFGVAYDGLAGWVPDARMLITTAFSFPVPNPVQVGGYTLNIARDTGLGTKIATIWVNWNAVGCRFQAQAIQSPQP